MSSSIKKQINFNTQKKQAEMLLTVGLATSEDAVKRKKITPVKQQKS